MKKCRTCKRTLPLEAFHADKSSSDGVRGECKACRNVKRRKRYATKSGEVERAQVRAYRTKNPDRVLASLLKHCKADPTQKRAQQAVVFALRANRLQRAPRCQMCGRHRVALDAHHSDYSKPLDVIWVCRSCHAHADAQRRKAEGKPAYYGCIKVKEAV